MPKPNAALIDTRNLHWVPLLLAVCLNGCSYYSQLAVGQLDLLRQRQPIETLIADDTRDPALRQRLTEVLQARTFASQALDLPDNRSYRLYAELGRVDDALFDFMQAPGQRQDATRYIDAMRELRLRRSQIEKRFQEEIGVNFKALLDGRVRVADFSSKKPEPGNSFSLVSEEDLEVQLAAKQLSQSLEHGFGQLFTQLDQRVGWLAGGLELGSATNPVGPGHIAAAIHFATSECDVSLQVKLILYKLCERELAAALEDAYHHINHWLIESGVLPTLPQLRA
ncbi:MAG: hypothetical protein CVV17_12355, partial [Gammaproteobacteria bacterium HGW-Gammaproteobacteria-7]